MKPYLKYYFTKYNHVEKSKVEFLAERLSYHETCGKDGFLSERTTLSGCYANAEGDYERHISMKDCKKEVRCVALTGDSEKDTIKMREISNQLDFISWVGEKE